MDQAFYPRLISPVTLVDDELVVARDGKEYALTPGASSLEELQKFLGKMDGTVHLDGLIEKLDPKQRARFASVISDLDDLFLIDDANARRVGVTGGALLAEIEPFVTEREHHMLSGNPFWKQLTSTTTIPAAVPVGFVLETILLWSQRAPLSVPATPGGRSTQRALHTLASSVAAAEDVMLTMLVRAGIAEHD